VKEKEADKDGIKLAMKTIIDNEEDFEKLLS